MLYSAQCSFHFCSSKYNLPFSISLSFYFCTATEHERIVSELKRGDVVYDMFAGIGPFSVPAAKKFCIVYANDLNPESYRWLEQNIQLNKVKGDIIPSNKDGRDFVKDNVKNDLLNRWKEKTDNPYRIHFVMNLPALAIEFLDVFRGLMSDVDQTSLPHYVVPYVHCHCFSKSETPEDDVRERVEVVLENKLPDDNRIRLVRKVAPNKDMMCISFSLEESVLFAKSSVNGAEPQEKRLKLDPS